MSATAAVLQQFREDIKGLASKARPTDMPDAERVDRAKHVFMKRLGAGIAINIESCIHCGMCAEVCHFYEGTGDPKYAPVRKFDLLKRTYRRELSPLRWFYRVFVRGITAKQLEQWQELVYDSCTACGRCDMVCPMGIGISETIRVTREGLAAAGFIPAELRAVDQEQQERGTVLGVGPEQLKQVAAELESQGIAVPIDRDRADVMVLSSALNLRLFKTSLAAAARIMNALDIDWTMRSEGFDGDNYGYLSGNHEAQTQQVRRIIDAAESCGAKTVITPECGHAYPALRWEGANEYGQPLPFEVLAISEFMAREIRAGRLKVRPINSGKTVTFHDPCRMGRKGGLLDEPRVALHALGVDLREMESHGRTNFCCGGGEGVNWIARAAPLRQKAFALKMAEVNATGADSVVTSCDSCRYNFITGSENANWDKPIESLVEMVAENLDN
jgi:Fe-S oxidoreductase